VETCADCQQALEELTGTAAPRTVAEGPGQEESGADFLRRLEQEPQPCALPSPGEKQPPGRRDAALPKHLLPGEPTAEEQGAGLPGRRAVRVAFLPAASPQTADEVPALLRKRLRIAFLIAAVALGSSLPLTLVNIAWMGSSAPGVVWQSFALFGVLTCIALAMAVLLLGKRPLSLGQLRAIELVMVGMGVVYCVWKQSSYLESTVFLTGLQSKAWPLLASYHSLPWFALLAMYGLFVPTTWRRCAVVVAVLALCPFVVLAVDLTQPRWQSESRHLVPYLTILGSWVAVGAGVAVYGSHHIAVLQQEASAARRLGQYRLQRRLGAGGMGEVYLAEHALLRRPCAVKLIRPERAGDPATLKRFEREVQAMAALTHPNTAEVYDYGHAADGTFYYVMEYLPGLSLEELVARHGPLLPERAVHLLRQVCAALHEAHAAGLVHRDVKPGNVLVCERGGLADVAKLLDFGLVRGHGLDSDAQKLTRQGAIAGTPAYMSPEQAAGREDVDGRTDIYSLGAVAYFLLTGQPPFVRQTAVQTLAAHLGEPVVAPDRLRPEVPADLQAVMLRCLEKEPARRFQEAESLEKALGQCGCAGRWTQQQAAAWWRAATASPRQKTQAPAERVS
jgi:serine/threonine-protein kinase